MISIERAWPRIREMPQFKNFRLSDFRHTTFNLILPKPVPGLPLVRTVLTDVRYFPGGAIILGITASATPHTPGAPDNFLYRKSFGLAFEYTNGERLTPGALPADTLMADSLLGGGDGTIFPLKEIVIAPNQGLVTTMQNFITTDIDVNVGYHCLVWRTAS